MKVLVSMAIIAGLMGFVSTASAKISKKSSWEEIIDHPDYRPVFPKVNAGGTYKSIKDFCLDGNTLHADPVERCELKGYDWVCEVETYSAPMIYTKKICVEYASDFGLGDYCLKYKTVTKKRSQTMKVPVYRVHDVMGEIELLDFKKNYTIPACN